MRKRFKMSRRSSRRVFKKYTGIHRHNNAVRHVMRGGVRM